MKIHILLSPDPPLFGTTLQALCGAKVPSAAPLAPNGEQPTNSIMFCRNCQETWATGSYFAWIVSGEESKQMEGES